MLVERSGVDAETAEQFHWQKPAGCSESLRVELAGERIGRGAHRRLQLVDHARLNAPADPSVDHSVRRDRRGDCGLRTKLTLGRLRGEALSPGEMKIVLARDGIEKLLNDMPDGLESALGALADRLSSGHGSESRHRVRY